MILIMRCRIPETDGTYSLHWYVIRILVSRQASHQLMPIITRTAIKIKRAKKALAPARI